MQVMNFSSTNCKNCYKCVRTCAVKAIEVKNDRAHIVAERCVACGHCLVVCPQNARDVKSNLQNVKEALKQGREVVVSLAPSYHGYYEESEKFVAALKKLGVSRVEETSIGAEMVSCAYETYIADTNYTEMITTCCPSTVRLIERYYSDLIPHMIPIVSPMIAHGRFIKLERPQAYVVFIGPCISKICESLSEEHQEEIDAVVTFDEMTAYLEECGIQYKTLDPVPVDGEGTLRGHRYPVVGGVLNGIRQTIEDKGLEVLRVHGMENSKEVLSALQKGELKNVCIEINSCNESCIAGPGGINQEGNVFTRMQGIQKLIKETKNNPIEDTLAPLPEVCLDKHFHNKQVMIHTASEEEIVGVLHSIGKYEKKDELNCGACGYETCRAKAVAVINGMSQIDMCLPYTRSIAERLSNEIFYNSPNSILILDAKLNVIDMNPKAEDVFGYQSTLMKGKKVGIMMDSSAFEQVATSKTSASKEKIELPQYGLVVYRDIIYLEKQKALLVIFADVTYEEERKKELAALKVNTLDVTQSIIDKQMRVAQEIASLLGETTAETKVAIMKLRKVLQEEEY
ncbi:MAG: [Fe-Fe] hydrogenase large subunit C-terminal domain-containing protein [Cellulosilyticaceae bacterium]